MNPEEGFGVEKRVYDGAGVRRIYEHHGTCRHDFLWELLLAGESVVHYVAGFQLRSLGLVEPKVTEYFPARAFPSGALGGSAL
jgi:hypothetical protein